MKQSLKVTQIGSKCVVELPSGKIQILGLRSIRWNLKHVFGLPGGDVLAVMAMLGDDGFTNRTVEVAIPEVA